MWDVWGRGAAHIMVLTCREDMAVVGKYNIKLDLKVIGWGRRMEWSGSGYRKVAGWCERSNKNVRFHKTRGIS